MSIGPYLGNFAGGLGEALARRQAAEETQRLPLFHLLLQMQQDTRAEAERQRILAQQGEDRQRTLADLKVRRYLELGQGDPQRAYQIGGEDFLTAWEASGGGKIPTRQVTTPITEEVPTPDEGGLSRSVSDVLRGISALRPRTQTVQTGTKTTTELNLPAPPAPKPKTTVLYDERTGRTQTITTPADWNLVTYQSRGEPQRYVGVDAQGNTKVVYPPGFTPHNLPNEPHQYVGVDAQGKIKFVLRPGLIPHNVQTPGEKPPPLSELNAIWQQSLAQATVDELGKRSSGGLNAAAVTMLLNPNATPEQLQAAMAGVAPLTDEERKRRDARAKEIYNQRLALPPKGFTVPPVPTVKTSKGKTMTEAQLTAIARKNNVPLSDARKQAVDQGYTILP